jgi:hypothetical protein
LMSLHTKRTLIGYQVSLLNAQDVYHRY